jgi:thiol reductant ABC exporter CydD subunit
VRALDPRLLRYGRATAPYLAVVVALGVATAVLVVVQAGLIAHAIAETFLGGAGLDQLRGTLVALVAVVGLRAVLAWAVEVASLRASATVKAQLRRQVLARAVALGPRWLAGRRRAEITTLTTRGLDALDAYFAGYLPQLVLAVLVPVVVLARIVPADLVAAVTIAVTLPLIPVFMALVGLATEARNRRRWRALARLGHHFLDVVSGLGTLKVFGRATAQVDNIRRVTDDYRRATMGTLRIAFLSSLVLELLATLAVALVAVGIGLRLVHGDLDLETALLVLILAPEAYLPLRQVGARYHACTEGLAAAEEAFAVLEAPSPPVGTCTDVPVPAQVRLRGLTVRHEDRDVPAPTGLDLDLRGGEVVGLAGPSGTGKTTVLHVLLGLLAPDEGRVEVTGPTGSGGPASVDLAALDPESWRARVAWVPQDPVLTGATVAEAVRLGRPSAGDAAVLAASSRAGLVDDCRLPHGLATPIGEAGGFLSAGQRRRVALARALLRRADLLLLDEPTAGLDATSERAVLDAVRDEARRGAAVLLVAHRPAALAGADRVVRLTPIGADASALEQVATP